MPMSALARDFDPENGVLSYIDSKDRKFVQKKIVHRFGRFNDFEVIDLPISQELKNVLELDEQGVTRFATFARYENFWIFGDDQA